MPKGFELGPLVGSASHDIPDQGGHNLGATRQKV